VAIHPALRADAVCWEKIKTLHDEAAVWCGFSPLCEGAWMVKLVAADSPALRRAMAEVRKAIYASTGCAVPDIRRVTGEN
jgi:hypothetical protein